MKTQSWIQNDLRSGERLDDLQIKGYEIIQDPSRFCFGMDAVLLSNFVSVKEGETVMDLGTGTGIIPILLAAKHNGMHYTGLEIQEESAGMARRSVAHNGLEDKIDIVTGDIKEAAGTFKAASFHIVTANPPYMINEHGLKSGTDAMRIARHEVACTLEDVLQAAAFLLGFGGRFYMVHRPFRLPEIMTKMSAAGLEPKRMRMVYPYVDREPNMVLIEGRRGGKPRMKSEPPLIIYRPDGSYTDEVKNWYIGPAWDSLESADET